MPFSLDFDREHNFVSLAFRMPDSLDQHNQARLGILERIRLHNCHRILVDLSALNAPTSMSREEQFSFTQSWKGRDFSRCIFAVLLPEDQAVRDDWYFVIHFIREQGVEGQAFSKRRDAIEWLVQY